jgi:predicted transcriptional regulator
MIVNTGDNAMTSKAVKLDGDTYDRLKALGETRQRTPHWLMKEAIKQFLDREEVAEREKREDMERWKNYEMTGYAIPHKNVAAWLSSWGTENELPCPK